MPGEANLSTEDQGPDRLGLTGSARLLQDIHRLDLYRFETERRKLNLTKTLSLAELDPFAFQRFRETGVLPFSTPKKLFDRDFPGHYLRLIKRVRTTVIALVPPVRGIRATLSSTGISRAVVGPEIFQTILIRRDPESVALTSPIDATGVFELQPETEMLLPFEGLGMDSTWEFRLPKPANPLDYRTIADVLITFEYTAMDSFAYRAQVIQDLDRRFDADRPFSFRHQFPDQWWDLHNPEQTANPMEVSFSIAREDFPPNIDGLKVRDLILYFVRRDGASFELQVENLQLGKQADQKVIGGAAATVDGIISTRRGNAGGWMALQGESPVGAWTLVLQDTSEIRRRFSEGDIEDILFVIGVTGIGPEWPK
jgi:hypothetical protein